MKTHEILFQTLSQADDYVNGEQLAKELGVSRTSIWKAIQRLEKDGVVIESLKKKGYRLVSGDILLPEVIASNTQLTVTLNEECHSTQLDAKLGMEAHKEGRALYLAASVGTTTALIKGASTCPFISSLNCPLRSSPHIPSWSLEPSTRLLKT